MSKRGLKDLSQVVESLRRVDLLFTNSSKYGLMRYALAKLF